MAKGGLLADYDVIIAKACKDHGITLVDAVVEGREELAERFGIIADWLLGRSYQIGDTIILGDYVEDFDYGFASGLEVRIAAFFHELGHFLDKKYHETVLGREQGAWDRGFEEAARYGLVDWGEDVSSYITFCLDSHDG